MTTGLLIHMGNDGQGVPQSLRLGKLTWSDVKQKQETTKASLMLIIAPSDVKVAKWMAKYFPGWEYEHVMESNDTLICAWDSHSWQHQSFDLIHVLNQEESSCGDRIAISIVMQDLHGSSFRLVLANIFRGTTVSGNALNSDLVDECWRVLIETAITEPRWLLLGDLATHNFTNIINRFANHSDQRVRSLKNLGVISEEPPLVVVSCNIRLNHAPSLGERQSLVFKIPDSSKSLAFPTRRLRDNFHSNITRSLEWPTGLRDLREWLIMLGEEKKVNHLTKLMKPSRDSVVQDPDGIQWEEQACLFTMAHKIEKAINLILDARAAVGYGQSGMLTDEQKRDAEEYLKERCATHSQSHHKNDNPNRGAYRAFIKQQVGDFPFAMHLLRYGISDDSEDMSTRYQYIVEAKAMKARELCGVPTRKSHPHLHASAKQARREYRAAEKLTHLVDNGTVDLRHVSSDDRLLYRKFKDDTLCDKMYTANNRWGHGSGVLKPPSTLQRTNIQHTVQERKKQKLADTSKDRNWWTLLDD